MASEARVLSFVHHTHAAAAKLASYDIVREGLPDYGFHDSRTGMNSSCKTDTGQGNSALRQPFSYACRLPLAIRWTRYVGLCSRLSIAQPFRYCPGLAFVESRYAST